MKKLLAVLLIAVLLIPVVVYSCDAVLPNVNTETDMCGEVWVAVQSSSNFLFGMLSTTERVNAYPAQADSGKVHGITARGVNRAKGEMRLLVADNTVCGLTRVRASVHISAEYLAVVTSIIHRNMGEDAEVTAENVIACTIRRTSCTVTHMMVGRTANKAAIGTVLFGGSEMAATLYITDWDGDGNLDIVFSVNPGSTTTKATPAPTSTPKPGKTKKPTATPKPECNKECVKIMIQVNIEKITIQNLNIDSIFKPCNKSVEGC